MQTGYGSVLDMKRRSAFVPRCLARSTRLCRRDWATSCAAASRRPGSQYGLEALDNVVPLLLLIAPGKHVDYVNDQRSLLDLAVRMTFISIAASATAVLFLWPRGLWVLIAVIPYAVAYVSYRGSIVAAQHYGWALDALINLDRFTLYEKLHLKAPATTQEERIANAKLSQLLFDYGHAEAVAYKHPPTSPGPGAPSE